MKIKITNSYFESIEITDIEYYNGGTLVIYMKENGRFGKYDFDGFVSLETIVRKLYDLFDNDNLFKSEVE